ncbi:hypothetical protein AX16_006543 [Volvariella volvacea WC 439]|nr:hypothetical protein AX16_006543 [Volvariella volvacea WC 439]
MPPQNARERSDLTRQIKSILDGYPFGIAILRELLQNSDDAQATTQTFILDCRTHGTESLAHPALVGCQGPALLAVNDSVFKDPEDWEALRKLHGSNKALDENKTGKYGLGFRANYHLTDNPHVLSGDRLYIADPHERLPGVLNGGAYFSLKDGDGVEYSSHFNAFQAAGVDSRSDYVNQTIIRLPLRTASQAEISEICKTPTTIEGIRTLFKSFITNELDIILLFLRNVTRIEVVEVGEDGRGILLGRAMLTKSTNPPAVSRAATYLSSSSLFDYLVVSFDQPEHRTTWRSYRRTYDRRYVSNILSSRLCRSAEQLEQDLRQDKLVAEVALAYCLDPNLIVNGRLFASLPLPESISPKIPTHVHGNFALTSDRQHLKNFDQINDQENKRHRDGLLAHWNKAIFEEFIPPAWAALLEALAQDLKERNRLDEVWSAFPLQVSDSWGGHWGKILDSVLREVIESKFCVFPTTALGVQLPSVLQGLYIVDQRDSTCPWEILSRLGIMVAAPPIPIYELIKATSSILTPGPLLNELQQRVQALEQCTDPEKDAIIKYLLSEKQATLDMVLGLPIIPLASGKRIRLERQPLTRVHIVQGLGDRAVDAWMKLGIPFLDPEVPYNKVEPFGVTLKEDVTFFVEHVDPSRIAELLSSDWDEINASLTSLQRISFLGDKNLLIFKQFPIFPIRANLAEGEEGEKVSITHQGAIIGDHVFVQSSHNYPLPVLPLTTTFVDVRIEAGISRLLGGPPRMLGELGLLQMALEHWDIQPHYLRQRFLPRILARLTEMPSSIERVRNLPFITVGGRILPPHEVIDPESPIAGLYEDGDLPCKDFATHSMFGLLRMHGLICNKLTPELLNKRIHWISHNTHCSLPKAIHLLTVMDDEWDNRFITEVDGCRSLAWIPTADEALVSPSACFFNDYPNYHENSGRFGHEVSPIMTSLLAQRLKIPFLSALLADEDSGSKDEEAMSVELLSRIHAVLHDYDINYAVNEFIANAHDAGATEFSMMLDEMKYSEGERRRTSKGF